MNQYFLRQRPYKSIADRQNIVNKLSLLCKPLIYKNKVLYHNKIKENEYMSTSYIWCENNAGNKFDTCNFKKIQIPSYHFYTHKGLFTPSCEEVLYSIPQDIIDKTSISNPLYYITENPTIYDDDYYKAITYLYYKNFTVI